MAVFPNLKKVFIHIPRTGGTSVSLALNTLDKAPLTFSDFEILKNNNNKIYD